MLKIPHYAIKEERHHGARHVKTEAQKQYHNAFNAWKRCRKRVDGQKEHNEGIHDRFLRDQVFRDSQLKNWLDRAEMHRNGQVGTGGSLLPSIQRGIQEIPRTSGISHLTNRARMHRCDFDQTSELQSQSRTVSTENQAKNVQNPFFFNNTKDGTLLPRVIPGEVVQVQKLVEFMSSIHFLICLLQ